MILWYTLDFIKFQETILPSVLSIFMSSPHRPTHDYTCAVTHWPHHGHAHLRCLLLSQPCPRHNPWFRLPYRLTLLFELNLSNSSSIRDWQCLPYGSFKSWGRFSLSTHAQTWGPWCLHYNSHSSAWGQDSLNNHLQTQGPWWLHSSSCFEDWRWSSPSSRMRYACYMDPWSDNHFFKVLTTTFLPPFMDCTVPVSISSTASTVLVLPEGVHVHRLVTLPTLYEAKNVQFKLRIININETLSTSCLTAKSCHFH